MSLPGALIAFLLANTVSAASTPTVDVVDGRDVIWQIPDYPKAILFLAHGCNGRAGIFWDESPACPNCVGLPEERRLVLDALDRGFAVLTISSNMGCWEPEEEGGNVTVIINRWVQIHLLEQLPLTALGISSGGYFVSSITTKMHFSSITLMISGANFDEMDVPTEFPPTLFVYMPKDIVKMEWVKNSMQILKQKHITVKEVRCLEFPLTPNLFSERIPGLNLTASIQLYELFRKEGFTDEKNYLKSNYSDIWNLTVSKGEIVSKAEHIFEELNLAYAFHVTTSLQSHSIFEWFESYLC